MILSKNSLLDKNSFFIYHLIKIEFILSYYQCSFYSPKVYYYLELSDIRCV